MDEFRSNCYGFVYAAYHNSEEEFFKTDDDLLLPTAKIQGKINREIHITSEKIQETLSEENDNIQRAVLQLFDDEHRSQHVAFLNNCGYFCDQNGPNGDIRLNQQLDDLLYQYHQLFSSCYYEVHIPKSEYQENISSFLNKLHTE